MRSLKLPFVTVLSLLFFIILFAAVAVYLVLPDQSLDPSFDASVASPAYKDRHPRVLFDEAHYNFHKSDGRYKPFVDLIKNDGYEVIPNRNAFTAGALQPYDVLVIANALGLRGAAQQLVNLFRLEATVSVVSSAFSAEEIAAVKEWVSNGGSLLLIADHAPTGSSAGELSKAFGVEMTDWYAEDPTHNDPETRNPSFLLYTRENGLLAQHPVTEGVSSVLTFTGQSLKPPPNAVSFLKMSPEAVEFPKRRAQANQARSAANLSQGVALEFGTGRVVVLGEAAMLTSQVMRAGGRVYHSGMSHPEHQNRQLALNIMHWLSEDPSVRHQP